MKVPPPRVSILIPCHNEEKTIRACLNSCLRQTLRAHEIVIVNHGSTDATANILRTFGNRINVVELAQTKRNKSYAQEFGLSFITGDVFICTDADTLLDNRAVELVATRFRDPSIIALGGYVQSMTCNMLTACRELDYMLAHIYKRAQSYMQAILVIPGCIGAFRTREFRMYLTFDHDTLTEDLDITYKAHEHNFRVVYDPRIVSYTQDPDTFSSYVNQTRRWYSGGWQNLHKHRWIVRRPGHALQLALVYIEGTIFSASLFIMPLLNPWLFLFGTTLYLCILSGLGLFATIKRRRADLLLAVPLRLALTYVHAWILLEQCVKEFFFKDRNLVWFQPSRREVQRI